MLIDLNYIYLVLNKCTYFNYTTFLLGQKN